MVQVKETGIGGWMRRLGRRIGRLLLVKRKSKNQYTPPLSEKEIHNRVLLRVMCGISHDVYDSEWEDGLEYELWAQCIIGMSEDGACLRLLSERAGGWWIWSEEQNKPQFISVRNWSGHYDVWRRKWKKHEDSSHSST